MAYCTNAEVKTRIGGNFTEDDDELITTLISEAQAWIDTHTGTTFEASANTSRTFDSVEDVSGLTLFFDEWMASINSVTNGDGTTVASTEYVTQPRNDTPYFAIKLLRSSSKNWLSQDDGDNEDAITVNGKWAWSETVPTDVKRACIQLAAFYYRSRVSEPGVDNVRIIADGIMIEPLVVPKEILMLLRPYKRILK